MPTPPYLQKVPRNNSLLLLHSCSRAERLRAERVASRAYEAGGSRSPAIAQVHHRRAGRVRDTRGAEHRQPGAVVRGLDAMGVNGRRLALARAYGSTLVSSRWYPSPYRSSSPYVAVEGETTLSAARDIQVAAAHSANNQSSARYQVNREKESVLQRVARASGELLDLRRDH